MDFPVLDFVGATLPQVMVEEPHGSHLVQVFQIEVLQVLSEDIVHALAVLLL